MHSAEGWEELLLPEIERQQQLGKEVAFRDDAAFARPQVFNGLERDIAELLPRPVGRPRQKPLIEYKGFLYQAASWKMLAAWWRRWSITLGSYSVGWGSS